MAKTSLEKSHSKSSNFKLTLICVIGAIAVSALWAGVGLIKSDYSVISYILLGAGGVGTLLSLLLINKFTRG